MTTVWGNLAKAQDNNEKINDAISTAIVNHEADEAAHLGVGESLQSHKAAEIIDHVAESVVNDKLKPNARRYVAIVDVESPADFDNIPDAVAYANDLGGGSVFVKRGNYEITQDLVVGRAVDIEGEGIDETILNFGGNDVFAILELYNEN